MYILLLDDHTDTRSVLTTLLSRLGCKIVTAKNLAQARARLAEMPFQILITDLNLPDGDGLELIRESKKQHNLKVIALTGRESKEDRAAGIEAGADCYLTKPIDFLELKQAIGK